MTTETLPTKRYAKDKSIVFREIAGEFLLVPIRNKTSDIDGFYTLNEVAADIWRLIDGRNSVQDILDSICAQYEVSVEQAELDILELLTQLEEIGAIREI